MVQISLTGSKSVGLEIFSGSESEYEILKKLSRGSHVYLLTCEQRLITRENVTKSARLSTGSLISIFMKENGGMLESELSMVESLENLQLDLESKFARYLSESSGAAQDNTDQG